MNHKDISHDHKAGEPHVQPNSIDKPNTVSKNNNHNAEDLLNNLILVKLTAELASCDQLNINEYCHPQQHLQSLKQPK